jgi:ADP-heptose:LPS heptosyltransferase
MDMNFLSRKNSIKSSHILICRTDNIGDVVLTLPMVRRLRELNAHARISFLCRRYATDVVKMFRHVDEVVAVEDIAGDMKTYFRDSGIDTVIFAQPDHALARAAFLARIRHRIGNARQKLYLQLFCNRPVRFSKRVSELHEAQINFEFLKPFGDAQIPETSDIWRESDFAVPRPARLQAMLAPNTFNLIFHPRSNGHGREWPVEHYTALAQCLRQHQGLRIWITGSADEGKWLNEHARELLAMPHVSSVCGEFSLAELASFIDMADGMMASGTGPLHLSGALEQRTIGLFPPTKPMHPARWAALGARSTNLCIEAASCAHCQRDERTCACMVGIAPEQVRGVIDGWYQARSMAP